ncbi:MAG: hypothetical protein KJZ69_09560 [Phycisphaerales bacterium]|nr:hypothetical protein [Phycisphaerales bacterium]
MSKSSVTKWLDAGYRLAVLALLAGIFARLSGEVDTRIVSVDPYTSAMPVRIDQGIASTLRVSGEVSLSNRSNGLRVSVDNWPDRFAVNWPSDAEVSVRSLPPVAVHSLPPVEIDSLQSIHVSNMPNVPRWIGPLDVNVVGGSVSVSGDVGISPHTLMPIKVQVENTALDVFIKNWPIR